MDKTNKILLIVLLIIFIGGFSYLIFSSNNKNNKPTNDYSDLTQEERQRRNIERPEQEVYLDIDRVTFEKYLKENISNLAPEDEVLGGEFMVTNVNWINNNNAFVYYEDGHVAYEAEVRFVYEDFKNKQNIKVAHFYPLTVEDEGLDENGELIESEDLLEGEGL